MLCKREKEGLGLCLISVPSLERPHLSNHKHLPPKKCRTKFGDESGFKICPQIIWYSSLQDIELNSPLLAHGLYLETCFSQMDNGRNYRRSARIGYYFSQTDTSTWNSYAIRYIIYLTFKGNANYFPKVATLFYTAHNKAWGCQLLLKLINHSDCPSFVTWL